MSLRTVPNKDPDFDVVLIFTPRMNSTFLQFMEMTFQQAGFTTLQVKSTTFPGIILFIQLSDPHILEQQAEGLYIYKTQKEQKQNIKDSLLKRSLDHKLHDLLNEVSPMILKYERLKRFRIQDKHLFINNQIFTSSDRLRIVYNYLYSIRISDINMIDQLRQYGYLEHIRALHTEESIKSNTTAIEEYFGENISVYFEFTEFYQKMLVVPGILAVVIFILQQVYPSGLQLGAPIIFYSIVVMIWTTVFILRWRRRESELCIKWGIFTDSYTSKSFDRNHLYQGSNRIKLTSGLLQEKYSSRSRCLHYIHSFFEALPMLILAGVIKLIIFNVNGLIKNQDSIMYIPYFAQLNQPSGLLYPIPFIATILDVLTIITITQMNIAYTKQSIKSTMRENHQTTIQFNNSVIIKRFVFELINRFMHLWYIAFVAFDLSSLKSLLAKSFIIDEVRKVMFESLIPMMKKRNSQNKKDDLGDTPRQKSRLLQLTLPKYENFDDYIEVIFQYAYVTVFAAVFPLASSLSYIFNLVEDRSDRFKLQQKLYQRNIPSKVNGIGQWKSLIVAISIISIYSNLTFIILSHYHMFERTSEEKQDQCGWEKLVLILFMSEHIILGIKYIISTYVQSKPKWVRVFLRRMKFQKSMEIK